MPKRKIIIGAALLSLLAVAVIALLLTRLPGDQAGKKTTPESQTAEKAPGMSGPQSSGQASSSAQGQPASPAAPAVPGAAPIPRQLSPVAQQALELARTMNTAGREYNIINNTMNQIVSLGPEAVPGLVAYLKETTPPPDNPKRYYNQRIGVLNLLGEMKSPEAVPTLAQVLQEGDRPAMINTSARSLGRIGGEEAYQALSKTLLDAKANPDDLSDNRIKASVLGLGLCGDERAVPLLKTQMADTGTPEKNRIYSAGSLGMLGDSSGLEVATEALESGDHYKSIAGARALGVIEDPSSIEVLKKVSANSYDMLLKEEIKLSLVQVEAAQKPGDEKAAYIKEQLLENPLYTPFVQWGTMELDRMDTPAADRALAEMAAIVDPRMEVLSWAAKIRSH